MAKFRALYIIPARRHFSSVYPPKFLAIHH